MSVPDDPMIQIVYRLNKSESNLTKPAKIPDFFEKKPTEVYYLNGTKVSKYVVGKKRINTGNK